MKKTLLVLIAAIFLAACNSSAPKENNESTEKTTYTVTSFMEKANELVDQEITIKGLVVHVCKHGGQKMFITSDDKETKIKINVSKTISEFDVALEGSMVEINGLVIAVSTAIPEHGEGEHHADETKDPNEDEGNSSKETEDCDTEETEETEDDCDFEKEPVVYEIKATSFKDINE